MDTTPTPEKGDRFNRRAFGLDHEDIALLWLQEKGYRLVNRNFRFGRHGEIDLIMKDGTTWVFIEVKARQNHKFGRPEDAVDFRKRKQVKKIARGYVHILGLDDYEARFDVLAIDYVTGSDGHPEIRHIRDAFR